MPNPDAGVPGERLLVLVGIMDKLRAECPWDKEQTHASLARHLLEESYETVDAIEALSELDSVPGAPVDLAAEREAVGHLAEELGDVLFQCNEGEPNVNLNMPPNNPNFTDARTNLSNCTQT